jgi:carbamoyltransferase
MAEEERLNRVKHGKSTEPDQVDDLPLVAAGWCLAEAGIGWADVDVVGFSSNPDVAEDEIPEVYAELVVEYQISHERILPKLRALGFRGELMWIDHHMCHAASAFLASAFDDAAVLAIDGIGNLNTAALYHGQGGRLRRILSVPYPHSVGYLWELFSTYLGFEVYDATKIMGLAAYGDPAVRAREFEAFTTLEPDGLFTMDDDVLRFWMLDYDTHSGYWKGLESIFGLPRRQPSEPLEQAHHDVAAALQVRTDQIVGNLVERLYRETGSANLCIAGGVALNCVTNRVVFEDGPFTELYVQPAAHDAGTALGAALFVWSQIQGQERRFVMDHAYWGPEFDDAEIVAALDRAGLVSTRPESIEVAVADLLAAGGVVGWFQGRMEAGPRALGNRSLLADPRDPAMREVLNHKVKHREYFRPFAPSVLAEKADEWFAIAKPTITADFMLLAYPAHEAVRHRIPAVVHADGTCRVQTVRRSVNPRYHRLIAEFEARTGVPMVLNTSFNDSEPIVCTPDDAVATFRKTAIDHLAIGDHLVSRADQPAS